VQEFVNNQTLLVNFAVLIIVLAIVAYMGIWIKSFLGKLTTKMGTTGK